MNPGGTRTRAAAAGPGVPAWRALACWAALLAGLADAPTANAVAEAAPPMPAAPASTVRMQGFARRCAGFDGLLLSPAAIGLPTHGAQIDSAAIVAATTPGNQSSEFCRLTGRILATRPGAPDIRFDVNLPGRWNGRALQLGGGGYSGEVVSGLGVMPFSPEHSPLGQGYVTFGDDSGHVGNSALADFGLIDEAVVNFGYAHLKKTHDAALALIERAYGHAPAHVYFAGGSTGGREGYTVMQRYPDDYDGVIADSPSLNFSGVRLIGVKVGQAEYGRPGGFVPPSLLDRVYRTTLAVCDPLDGADDGIVSNVAACRAREQDIVDALHCGRRGAPPPAPLAGAGGPAATCLTDAQLATLFVLRDGLRLPYPLAWGVRGYEGYNVFQGTRFTGVLGLGHASERLPLPTFFSNGYLFAQGSGYIRYFVTQNADFDALAFDLDRPGRYRHPLAALSETIGAMNPDLSRYIARGGKLITLQGLADEVISPNQTIAYHDALVVRYGAPTVDGFMRLYMVPGFQHGNGVFVPSVDLLGALDAWVTRGVAPQALVATDLAAATNGRTRPLCRYPLYPRYVGRGSLDRADNFRCTAP